MSTLISLLIPQDSDGNGKMAWGQIYRRGTEHRFVNILLRVRASLLKYFLYLTGVVAVLSGYEGSQPGTAYLLTEQQVVE